MRISSTIGTNNATLTAIVNAINALVLPFSATIISFQGRIRTGAHALTVRDTYIVPVGSRAVITALSLHVRTEVAPGVIGDITTQFRFTPSGGAQIDLLSTINRWVAANEVVQHTLPCFYRLSAGDLIDFATTDISTASAVDYSFAASIVEDLL